jgi:hypothetical protein
VLSARGLRSLQIDRLDQTRVTPVQPVLNDGSLHFFSPLGAIVKPAFCNIPVVPDYPPSIADRQVQIQFRKRHNSIPVWQQQQSMDSTLNESTATSLERRIADNIERQRLDFQRQARLLEEVQRDVSRLQQTTSQRSSPKSLDVHSRIRFFLFFLCLCPDQQRTPIVHSDQ